MLFWELLVLETPQADQIHAVLLAAMHAFSPIPLRLNAQTVWLTALGDGGECRPVMLGCHGRTEQA